MAEKGCKWQGREFYGISRHEVRKEFYINIFQITGVLTLMVVWANWQLRRLNILKQWILCLLRTAWPRLKTASLYCAQCFVCMQPTKFSWDLGICLVTGCHLSATLLSH